MVFQAKMSASTGLLIRWLLECWRFISHFSRFQLCNLYCTNISCFDLSIMEDEVRCVYLTTNIFTAPPHPPPRILANFLKSHAPLLILPVTKRRNVCKTSVGIPEGKKSLGRSRSRWTDNIKIKLTQTGFKVEDWMNLALVRVSCEYSNGPFGYID
jgi:hypothetical protein